MSEQPITDWLRTEVEAALAAGESQRALAARAGADHNKLSRWRRGEATLNLETADRLAVALGLAPTAARPHPRPHSRGNRMPAAGA